MRILDKDVSAALIESADGQVVLGHKHDRCNGVYNGMWVLPGGIKDQAETSYESAEREVFEETGIDLKQFDVGLIDSNESDIADITLLSGEKVQFRMNFFRFHARTELLAEQILLIPSEEMPDIRWVRIEDLAEYDHCPPSIQLFAKLGYIATV